MRLPTLTWRGKTFAGALALAFAFIATYEGRRLVAYPDTGGVWSICDGHTKGVQPGDTATPEQCDTYLTQDTGVALAEADAMLTRKQNDYVRVVTADMIYQFGAGKVRTSTMVRKLNAGDREGGCRELHRWVNAVYHGKFQPLPGIVRRRADAYQLCMQED